jgi:ubiquinone/menaquinone biosynthesis C-methylase UbiE
MARVDYDRMAESYDRARAVPLDGLGAWRQALARHLPPGSGLPVLDLGSGTGQFAEALVRWFGVQVIGVEPSPGMRAEAVRRRSLPEIRYLAGEAERIPLAKASCGAAWLSTVIHHLDDLRASARELRRVLARGAPVVIRNAFPGRLERLTVLRFFPEARKVAETFPELCETIEAFEVSGFGFVLLESLPQVTAPSLRDLRQRVLTRADTTLAALTEREFQRGLEAMDLAIAAELAPGPVIDYLDLLVLR